MGQFYARRSVSGAIPLTTPGSSCLLPADAMLSLLGATRYTGLNANPGTVVDTYKSTPSGIAFASTVNETPGIMVMQRNAGAPTNQRAHNRIFSPISVLIQWGFDILFNPSGSNDIFSVINSANVISGTYKGSTICKRYDNTGIIPGIAIVPDSNVINGGFPVSPTVTPFGGSGFTFSGQAEFLLSPIAPEVGVVTQFDGSLISTNVWDLASYFANTGVTALTTGGTLWACASMSTNYVVNIPESYFTPSGNTDNDYWIRLSDCVPLAKKLSQPVFTDTLPTTANPNIGLASGGNPMRSMNSIMGCLSSFGSATSIFTSAGVSGARVGVYDNGAGKHYDATTSESMTLSRGVLVPQFYGPNIPSSVGVTNGPY